MGATWDNTLPAVFLAPFDHIAQAEKDRFTLRLLAPWLYGIRLQAGFEPEYQGHFHELAGATGLAVAWIGIEHTEATRPGGQHGRP
jgi:hypothetical protein